ncbi:hypothetical protein IWW36_003233 [Coemansia brasiliensis]|uniref:Uncharacterized protein n=1 Tax=Coemansia brasiliensis TaxID=2650707 RepID=A0A9W8LXE3_9FUNG|nr:hypothetical protein IWW36_003233 [Coemansia brasiliensis]
MPQELPMLKAIAPLTCFEELLRTRGYVNFDTAKNEESLPDVRRAQRDSKYSPSPEVHAENNTTSEPNTKPSDAIALDMLNIPDPNIVFVRLTEDDRMVPVGSSAFSSKWCWLEMLSRAD